MEAGLVAAVRRRTRRARLSPVSRRVQDERLTYLDAPKLRTLERLVHRIDRDRVAGDLLECGVALGGSAIVLATLMSPGRRFHGYDVFAMIPPPTDRDPPEVHDRYRVIREGRSMGIGGDAYYGYLDDLRARVEASFARHGQPVDGDRVTLHEGLFEDTLHPDGPVALAHVDSDWHDPVKLALERIWPALSPGGFVVLDDYVAYRGCRDAAQAFLAAEPSARLVQTEPNAVLAKGGS